MTRPWKKHDPGKLLTTTRRLLADTKHTHLDIYAATGIRPEWLVRFGNGKITDPGVNRVECLFAFLGGRWTDLGEYNI